MRVALLLVLASPAAADPTFVTAGVGATHAERPAWLFRSEVRQDFVARNSVRLAGARCGFEVWPAADRVAFNVPLGLYWGAQLDGVRTTFGAGAGLWNMARAGRSTYQGFAPFASASIEHWHDATLVSLDVRLARGMVDDADDINLASVVLMVGKRWE